MRNALRKSVMGAAVAALMTVACSSTHQAATQSAPSPTLAPKDSARPSEVLVPVARPSETITPQNGRTFATFMPAFRAVDGPFECSPVRPVDSAMARMARLPVGTVSYSGSFPTRKDYKSNVVVMVDTTGRIVRVAERRGDPIRVRPDSPDFHDVSTTIMLDLIPDRAIVQNHGTGDDRSLAGRASLVETLDQFEHPFARAERIIKQCRGTK